MATNNESNDYDRINTKKRPLSTPSTPDTTSKRVCIWHDDGHHLNDETNEIFNHFIMDYSTKNHLLMSTDDLRTLMIIKHRTIACYLEQKLWNIYLKAGMGQWETVESMNTNVDRRIWSTQVKRLITEHREQCQHNDMIDEHKLGETLVHQHLEDLNRRIEQYTIEYMNMKKNCFGWTDSLEEIIIDFVYQHSIVPYATKIIHQLCLWECDYDDQLLQRTYLQYQPTELQVNRIS